MTEPQELLFGMNMEQVENLVRVWEKNHVYKKFQKESSSTIGPDLVRATKVFKDIDLGWCVGYVNADINAESPPVVFKKFENFVASYKLC